MKKLKTALHYLEYAALVILLGFLIFGGVEYASGTQPFYVVSDNPSSMSPTIDYGGVAVAYGTPFSSIKSGDIIAFRDPLGGSTVVIHRVVSIVECAGGAICLETKGDNNETNPTIDPWNVTQQEYLSQIVLAIPYVGYMSPALWGFAGASILLPLATIFLAAILIETRRWWVNQLANSKEIPSDEEKDETSPPTS